MRRKECLCSGLAEDLKGRIRRRVIVLVLRSTDGLSAAPPAQLRPSLEDLEVDIEKRSNGFLNVTEGEQQDMIALW